jgi:DNA-directed RNA polymerase subunit N (RpoN/RPB10)
MQRKLKAVLD